MHIAAVGLNHRTAPVEFREQVVFPENSTPQALQGMLNGGGANEAVIISTCNRTEIYALVNDFKMGTSDLIDFLAKYHSLSRDALKEHLYLLENEDAVKHLFRVASSLDSMILGEAQILGQVKTSYQLALQSGATGTVINRLFHDALTVGKKVRTETEIGENPVSVSSAAVELAKSVFGTLDGRYVLLVGAGKMSELTAKHLIANGVSHVVVASRTFERAEEMANRVGGRAIPYTDAVDHFMNADIVISATGAPHQLIVKKDMSEIMNRRKHRPIFLIDIAVPRDIDPRINDLFNAYLYDIDDLQRVVDGNFEIRQKEAEKAERLVEEATAGFSRWMSEIEVVPTIAALREQVEGIRQKELEKALSKLGELDERQRNIVSALTTGIVNKILHGPTVKIKELTAERNGYHHVESIREVFGLDEDESSKDRGAPDPGKQPANFNKTQSQH